MCPLPCWQGKGGCLWALWCKLRDLVRDSSAPLGQTTCAQVGCTLAAELEGAERREAAAAAGGDAEALAAAKREVGKAAERYCAVCECEEEMRAKVRPDMVVEGRRGREKCDMAGLLEGKSFGTNPTRYGPGWGRLGLTAAERRAREEVRERWKAVDGIDGVQHAHVQPPPLRARVEGFGGIRVVAVGGFCEYNSTVHEFVHKAAIAIADAQRGGGRGGSRRERVGAVKLRLRRTLAVGAWADLHRAARARMQVIDPSPSQAQLMMERRARSDGEARQRMQEAQARRRARQGQDPRHAAGSGSGSAGAGGAEEQGSGSAGAPAAAAGAAGSDTDMENEQEVRRSESSSTAAAAKSITTMAAPTSEDDRSVEPDGGDGSGGSGSGERGRRRGCTERRAGGVPAGSRGRVGARSKNRVGGGGGEG